MLFFNWFREVLLYLYFDNNIIFYKKIKKSDFFPLGQMFHFSDAFNDLNF